MQSVVNFWKKSVNKPYESASSTLFFFILCLCEPFYRLGFAVYFWWRGCNQQSFPFPIFSVGNLSVGGAGKSVVVSFLADHLGNDGAIVTRGYGRSSSVSSNYLINNGKKLIVSQAQAGDEPAMFVRQHGLPVVVGANRARSLELAQSWYKERCQKIRYAILDDAYQNPSVRKDCEILLIDARRPFENNHCLPAGLLREKDYMRADVIILTHADEVCEKTLYKMVKNDLKKFDQSRIFYGKHEPVQVRKRDSTTVPLDFLNNRNVAAVAGIGSFEGFSATLKACGATMVQSFEFPDHHVYSRDEIEKIIQECVERKITHVITTAKDSPKLFPLLQWREESGVACAKPDFKKEERVSLYVLEVGFAFLTAEHRHNFMSAIQKKRK